MASDDFPTPPGAASTVISPRVRSTPYTQRRCGMFANVTWSPALIELDGPKPDAADTVIGGDHPCQPCFLARSKTVAMVMGLSLSNASSMYRCQRFLLSDSLYPGAWRDLWSRI